ncbi:MAG: hypothetical protein AAFV07_10875 [Bacteroidota bacterium]
MRYLIILLCLGFLLSNPLFAQNPFKKLEKKLEQKLEKVLGPDAREHETAAEAPAIPKAENPGPPTDSTRKPSTSTPKQNPLTRNEPTDSGVDESLFTKTDFDQTPITDNGVPGKGPYNIRSGIIIFEKSFTHPQASGTTWDTLYFTDYGKLQRRHSRTIQRVKMLGFSHEQSSRNIGIIRDGMLYGFDPETRKGTEMQNPAQDIMNLSPEQQQQFGEEFTSEAHIQVIPLGTDIVTGKRCAVSDQISQDDQMEFRARVWMYKNIALQMVSSGMGTNLEEKATSIRENVHIPASRFEVPKDVQFMKFDRY